MYDIFLTVHSILRWLVIIAFIIAIYRTFAGWKREKAVVGTDRKVGLFLMITFDIQLLIGLILFIFLSPITESAFNDMGNAMSNHVLRFFTVEHTLLMLISLVLVHIGYAQNRKTFADRKKHKRAFIYYLIAFILALAAIPWPFLNYGRAWI